MRFFYSHLIQIETITEKLDSLDLQEHHKKHLAELVDSHIHHTVLDVILSELSDEDKVIFLEKLHLDPQDHQLMEFLNQKTDNIEGKIKKVVEELKAELHQDLDTAREVK